MIDGVEVLKRIEKSMADWPYLAQCPEYTYEMLESAHKLLKEQKNEYENGFNDAMLGKQELMYEGIDGKWHKKDW